MTGEWQIHDTPYKKAREVSVKIFLFIFYKSTLSKKKNNGLLSSLPLLKISGPGVKRRECRVSNSSHRTGHVWNFNTVNVHWNKNSLSFTCPIQHDGPLYFLISVSMECGRADVCAVRFSEVQTKPWQEPCGGLWYERSAHPLPMWVSVSESALH